MKKRIILISILCIITIILSISIIAFNNQSFIDNINSIFTPEKVGYDFKNILIDNKDIKIVATINSLPIYNYQVKYEKYCNETILESLIIKNKYEEEDIYSQYSKFYPTDDYNIILQIAKKILLISEANSIGIIYNKDDAYEEIKKENDLIINGLNNKNITETQQKNEEFLKALNLTQEEYYELFYVDHIIYMLTYQEYVMQYFAKNNISDINEFNDHLNILLDSANIEIY